MDGGGKRKRKVKEKKLVVKARAGTIPWLCHSGGNGRAIKGRRVVLPSMSSASSQGCASPPCYAYLGSLSTHAWCANQTNAG